MNEVATESGERKHWEKGTKEKKGRKKKEEIKKIKDRKDGKKEEEIKCLVTTFFFMYTGEETVKEHEKKIDEI